MPNVNSGVSHSGSSAAETSSGWAKVARQKETAEKKKAEREANKDKIREFFMKDGEVCFIQFYSEEPYCSDFFRVEIDGRYKYLNTQLEAQSYCLMTQGGLKTTFRAVFKIADLRGAWDKEKEKTESQLGKDYTEVEPQEKIWYISEAMASIIKSKIDKKKGKKLTDFVWEVSRTGSGTNTRYSVEIARDEETEQPLPIVELFEEYESPEELCVPPTDAWLYEHNVIKRRSSR